MCLTLPHVPQEALSLFLLIFTLLQIELQLFLILYVLYVAS